MTRFLSPALLVLALPLAGCISFGAKPPKQLLTLSATAQIAPGTVQNSAHARSVVVQVPVTPAALATVRIPVQATPTTLAYVKDAAWSEPPSRLFARLVADTLTAQGVVVLSGVQSVDSPVGNLAGELRTFGFDASTREAVVTYEAALTRGGQTAVEKRRFEARVPVATIDAASAGTALNDAANRVAAEVATWVGR
ncbi:ABC-type transport auxiliary lipoprotein family protein [Sphingomonas sp.]|uniref:ABC-type transport auxiliary lipoprotein family protein n=1 Tax=Sphingomonas sp. TaxID=28214 RepID=UPI003CC6BEDF